MPRSEKKGATSAGGKKRTTKVSPTGGKSLESLEPRRRSKSITSDEGQQGTIGVVETAEELNKKDKKKRHKSRQDTCSEDDVSKQDQGGTIGGESSNLAPMSLTTNRDSLREDVMTQVLRDFNAKPVPAKAVEPTKPHVWPFFGLRKFLRLAHVGLHDAVLDGNIEIVKSTLMRYIRKYPAKINEHDVEGRTALSLALMEQREDIADLILSVEETDINNPDTVTGLSPLHNAVLLDLASSAQKLAFRGANVNSVDKVGMTPLMLASRLGHESMVEMLVDVFGAELDPVDKAGWTCLFYATHHNEVGIVEFLLMRGADHDHEDARRMKAIDWGEHMGCGQTCALFAHFESQLAP